MPSFHSPDEDPENSPSHGSIRFPNRPEELVESPAIKKLCDTLLQYSGTDAFQEFQDARAEGALSAERFTALVRSKSDGISLLLLGHSLVSMLEEGVDSHFADCVSSVVHVAHGLLTEAGPSKGYSKVLASKLVGSLLDLCEEDADFHAAVVDGLDSHDFDTMLRTVNDGDQFDEGYWSCLELQTICAPTLSNLQRMFDAHELVRDALGEHDYPSQALCRAVDSLAQRDFRGVFDLVVREFGRCGAKGVKHEYDLEMVEYAVAGLARASCDSGDQLLPLFFSTNPDEFEIAARMAIHLGRYVTPKPSEELVNGIRTVLFDALDVTDAPQSKADAYRQVLVLRALAALADPDKDLLLIQSCANKLVARGPSLELVELFDELAETYEEGFDVPALAAHWPIPVNVFEQEHVPNPQARCAQPADSSYLEGDDANTKLANAAISLSGIKRKSDAEVAGSQIEQLVRSEQLRPRRAEEGSVFAKLSEARAFSKRFGHLVLSGHKVAAAALLPEALSILKCSEERDIRASSQVELTYAQLSSSLVELACALSRDTYVRSVASARFSQADWNLLRSLHAFNDFEHGESGASVALAALSLRAALEGDDSWHLDYLRTATQAAPQAHLFMVPAYIAEQRVPGSSWQLLQKLDLRKHEEMIAWAIAAGVRLTLPDGYQRIFDLVSSKSGEEIAKGLIVAQALRHEISEEEREELLHITRHSLDEPGELGMDALTTFSCFAAERDSALEVLSFRVPIGIDPNRFRASQNLAIARVLKNHLLGHQAVREEELSEPWPPEIDE